MDGRSKRSPYIGAPSTRTSTGTKHKMTARIAAGSPRKTVTAHVEATTTTTQAMENVKRPPLACDRVDFSAPASTLTTPLRTLTVPYTRSLTSILRIKAAQPRWRRLLAGPAAGGCGG